MKITQARVRNYKAIADSGALFFGNGLNVIVGKNNVGKSALLESLALRTSNIPHRSLESAPSRETRPPEDSIVDLVIELEEVELLNLLADQVPAIEIPLQAGISGFDPVAHFNEALRGSVEFRMTWSGGHIQSTSVDGFEIDPSNEVLPRSYIVRTSRIGGEIQVTCDMRRYPRVDNSRWLQNLLAPILRNRIYAFKAERFGLGQATFGDTVELTSNASNLAQVLGVLQSNHARFDRLNRYLNLVFPEVMRVSVHPVGDHMVEARIWNNDYQSERDDLAVSLSQSGTGIGQVLAILYVLITSDFPRTILIDEPQSFLHPGAVRKLLDLLRSHAQHQYLITSHAPLVLTAANPNSLTVITKKQERAEFQQVPAGEAASLRLVLAEVGARLGDVFGADDVLWVEGRTEELVFPIIADRLLQRSLLGTAILGVVQTGDFEGRNPRATFNVYKRLTGATALLPPAIGFIFDRERRAQAAMDDLVRESGGSVRFIPRRMFENYLLVPSAIASILNELDPREIAVTDGDVRNWFELARENRKYFRSQSTERSDDIWAKDVNAAAVLRDLFATLTENRVNYDKVKHGVLLSAWIIENDPSAFAEVAAILGDFLPEQIQ